MDAPDPTTPPLRKDSTFSERLKMVLATPPAMPTAPGVRLPERSEETDGEALPAAIRLFRSAPSDIETGVDALGVECSDRVAGVIMREIGEGRFLFAAGEMGPPPMPSAKSTKVLLIELSLRPRGRNVRSSRLPLPFMSSSKSSSSLSSKTCWRIALPRWMLISSSSTILDNGRCHGFFVFEVSSLGLSELARAKLP